MAASNHENPPNPSLLRGVGDYFLIDWDALRRFELMLEDSKFTLGSVSGLSCGVISCGFVDCELRT
jgi:hypothetical protein